MILFRLTSKNALKIGDDVYIRVMREDGRNVAYISAPRHVSVTTCKAEGIFRKMLPAKESSS